MEKEEETQEVKDAQEALEAAQVQAAFSGEVPTATPEPVKEEPKEEPKEEVKEEPKIEYAQITKAELADLVAKASRVDGAYGEIGGIKRKLTQMETTNEPVVFTEQDFPELSVNFPELAAAHVKDMNKALGRFKVPKADPSALDKIVNERVASTRKELMDSHFDAILGGDWVKEVGTPEFKEWAKTQPKEIIESESVREVSNVLRTWKTLKQSKKSEEKPSSTRKQQLLAAVTPKGTGGGHQPNPDTDEAMQAAFDSVDKT